MFGGVYYGEVEGLVSIERWSYSRSVSCAVEYTMGRWRDWSRRSQSGVVSHAV